MRKLNPEESEEYWNPEGRPKKTTPQLAAQMATTAVQFLVLAIGVTVLLLVLVGCIIIFWVVLVAMLEATQGVV